MHRTQPSLSSVNLIQLLYLNEFYVIPEKKLKASFAGPTNKATQEYCIPSVADDKNVFFSNRFFKMLTDIPNSEMPASSNISGLALCFDDL